MVNGIINRRINKKGRMCLMDVVIIIIKLIIIIIIRIIKLIITIITKLIRAY